LSRIGSGADSRSVYGGFAVWQKGYIEETSYAYALDETPTMDLHLLAVELNTKQKKISSTYGMKDAQSSPFFRPWLERNNSELNEMIKAIKSNDFTALGQLAELNANEMHAINLTAQPEFTYFEPQTIQAIKLVEQLRTEGIECYYTIDAGPNIKVLCQLRNSKDIIQRFSSEFNNVNIVNASFGPGITYLD
uniref:diphosphomevalonate/mevalonate 3,5-bisphosphate decarboxylase family protein n=1 Tax=Lactobacillus crispatus TaxID=47770 RepID=UPI00358DA24C